MDDVKPQVKETVKEFTKNYVSEVVKESTKKLIKSLQKEKRAQLEAELKNRSAEEIERYFNTNAEFNNAFESAVDSTKEASLEKIQTSFEESFSKYLPPYQPTPFEQAVRWIKSPLHAGIIIVITVAVVIALVHPSLTAIANGPYSGTVNIPITFEGSASGGTPPYSYSWDFGDGDSSNLPNPTHAYSSVGTYTVTLTVTDSAERTAQSTAQVTVGVSKLTANANGPYSGSVLITFSGSASGGTPPYTYKWNFGDNSSSDLPNTTHVYSAGTYTATLTVTDSGGKTAENTTLVTVSVSKLIANANGPYSGTVNATISFTGSASGGTPPYTYGWNFGDNSSSDLQNPAYSYPSAGNYNATLTVTDSAGGTAQSTAQVTVSNGKTAIWDVYNFAGFYYDLDSNLGSESLQLLQTNLSATQRTIYTDNLIYTTSGQPKALKVLENGKTDSLNTNGLNNFDTMSSAFGNYLVFGWQGQPYVGIKNHCDKLAKLVIEQGNSTADKKTLTVGDTWDVGGGWTLTANSIDAKASPRQVWLTLSKDGVKKDDKVLQQGQIYTYVESSIDGESNVPLFVTYVDSVFSGATSDVVQFRYTWAINTSITDITVGKTFGAFNVADVDDTGKSLMLKNTDTTISLSRDTTVNLMDNLDFRVADSDTLRFMPVAEVTWPGNETRGTIWSESPIAGSIGGTGNTATWDAYNFAGFYYDLDDNLGSESLQILQTNLAGNQRTIGTNNLIYTTMGQPKVLYAVLNGKANDASGSCDASGGCTFNGLKQFDAGQMSSIGGAFNIIGWQAEPYVGIKNHSYKLAKLLIEQKNSTSDKKTMAVGETWDIGDGWTLTANSIDAKASPRQVWLTLSKDGVKKDDTVIQMGQIYTYVENNIGGESNVPLFVTYVDSIFSGATSDMVQFRYTWAIDTSITQLKGGDTYGVFNVVTTEPVVLANTQSTVTLSRDATVNLMGGLNFRIADSDVLRFMPVMEVTWTGNETRGTIWNEFPIPGLASR